ncbi:MAG: SpoIID/LytB domain-containing protein [Firmicutes bacterium]|nr:SpoIID/LytB domain-containing protein [Bacillota bacterium]
MRISKERGIVLGLVLVLAAMVVVLISWSSHDRNIVRQLEKEPELTVYINESGETQKMPLEEYIAAVVAGEMFPDWPLEAYAAQAILARSFTMDFMVAGGVKDKYGADVSTSVEETQAFNPQAVTAKIQEAAETTRGKVMTYDNRFVRGWFHAYSGGMTARAKEGLDYQGKEPPFTKSVKLPPNEFADEEAKNWTVQYNPEEVSQLLAQAGLGLGRIEAIKITERGPSNRVTKIKIQGSQGQKEISGQDFRLAMGSTKMKSTLLDQFEFSETGLKISGSGYGHGVGLSQWDAYKMAVEGKSAEEIVASFFQGVKIRKIYN